MNTKIISQEKNASLHREEYVMHVSSEKNPSKQEIVDAIKKDAALTVVKQIKGSFGKGDFEVEAVVYDSKEAMDKVETLSRKTRDKIKEDAKKAAEAAKVAPAQ